MRIAAITLALALAASPAAAKWHYCYDGDAPAGVNRYTDYPPRTFGFEIAVLPYNFKRLCGVDATGEAGHIRRIVADYLECSAGSDLAQRIEAVLGTDHDALLANYFTKPPSGANWDAVCAAARVATIEHLAFGDTWYFDSPHPAQDRARLDALLAALNILSEAQQ